MSEVPSYLTIGLGILVKEENGDGSVHYLSMVLGEMGEDVREHLDRILATLQQKGLVPITDEDFVGMAMNRQRKEQDRLMADALRTAMEKKALDPELLDQMLRLHKGPPQ